MTLMKDIRQKLGCTSQYFLTVFNELFTGGCPNPSDTLEMGCDECFSVYQLNVFTNVGETATGNSKKLVGFVVALICMDVEGKILIKNNTSHF